MGMLRDKFLKLLIFWSLGIKLVLFISLTIELGLSYPDATPQEQNVPYNPILPTPTFIIVLILMIFATIKLHKLIKNEVGKELKWYHSKPFIFFSLWLLYQFFWGIILSPILNPLRSFLYSLF